MQSAISTKVWPKKQNALQVIHTPFPCFSSQSFPAFNFILSDSFLYYSLDSRETSSLEVLSTLTGMSSSESFCPPLFTHLFPCLFYQSNTKKRTWVIDRPPLLFCIFFLCLCLSISLCLFCVPRFHLCFSLIFDSSGKHIYFEHDSNHSLAGQRDRKWFPPLIHPQTLTVVIKGIDFEREKECFFRRGREEQKRTQEETWTWDAE